MTFSSGLLWQHTEQAAQTGETAGRDKSLPLWECIKILGLSIDHSLRVNHHIVAVAYQIPFRVSALRRMADTRHPI